MVWAAILFTSREFRPFPQVPADARATDLDGSCHTPRIRLSGTLLGDLFCRVLRVRAAALAKDGWNILKIEVANAQINCVALEILGIPCPKTMCEDAKTYIIKDILFQHQTKDTT